MATVKMTAKHVVVASLTWYEFNQKIINQMMVVNSNQIMAALVTVMPIIKLKRLDNNMPQNNLNKIKIKTPLLPHHKLENVISNTRQRKT